MTADVMSCDPEQRTAEGAALAGIREIGRRVTEGRGTPTGDLSPLDMARNCVRFVRAAADWQNSPDPEQQLLARVHHVGAQADQDSKVAARMALVSIAEDLHRLVEEFLSP
jgi:hypothetical protein